LRRWPTTCAVALLDLGELAAHPDVGADLIHSPNAPVDHGVSSGFSEGKPHGSPAGIAAR
jgi:hypothetical protein